MGGVAAVLLVALAAVAWRGQSTTMGYLYTDLDPSAASSIADKLKTQNVPFELSADGTAIMAPQDKLAQLRMSMAGDRLGGKIGYEVLDDEQPFGVSASRAKLDEQRAIEGELELSIQSLDAVSKARVHLVLPERTMFSNETQHASASVTLRTRGRLPGETVQAIRYLVASAVPDLSPDAVSIVDQTGALLARAGDPDTVGASDVDQRQAQVEGKLRDQIVALLEPIVGQGKVRAAVAAQIDRDQTREESSVFDPDKQVIAHQVTVESNDQNQDSQASPAASVSTQLPEAQASPTPTGSGDTHQSANKQSSEDTTYANSQTHSIVTRMPGKVTKLSVAVMIDGGEKGLPQAEIQRLTRLVQNSVGIDATRGDSVVVDSMPFAAQDPFAAGGGAWWALLTQDQVVGLIKLLVLAGVGLIALRMIKNRKGVPGEEAEEEDAAAIADRRAEMLTLADQAAEGDPEALKQLEAMRAATPETPLLDQDITLNQVDGQIKASVLRKIGELVAGSPPEATAVIRQWMNA